MKGESKRRSKAALGLVAMSAAAIAGDFLKPLMGIPKLSWVFALALGGITFLIVVVLGFSIIGGPEVPRRRR